MKITVETDPDDPERDQVRVETDGGPVYTFTGRCESVLEPEPTDYRSNLFQFGGLAQMVSDHPSFRFRLDIKGVTDVVTFTDAPPVTGHTTD